MQWSEQRGDIAAAIAAAQSEVEDAAKDRQGNRAKYATLESIYASVRPVFSRHGIAIVQSTSTAGTVVSVTTCFAHSSGQWVESTASTEITDDKQSMVQAVGSATTYLRRYGLMAMAGIAPEDDDEGVSAGRKVRERKSGKTPAQLLTDAVDSCGLTEAEIRAGLDLLGKGWPATDDEARKLAAWLGGKGPRVLREKLDAANAPGAAPGAAGKFAAYPAGQAGFMAEIAKHGFSAKGKATYEELASYCEAHGRPRPSAMDADAMGKLLAAIRDRDLATTVCEWVARGEADVSR